MNVQTLKFEPYVLVKGFKSLKQLVDYVNSHHVQLIKVERQDWMTSYHCILRFYKNNAPKVCCLINEPLKEGQIGTVDFIYKEGFNHV